MSGRFVQLTIRALDSLTALLPRRNPSPRHLRTGVRGEEEAYFYLRRQGYVIIARNYRTPHSRSELDIVAWDGDTLCFIEVKTRTSRSYRPAEMAVDFDKQCDLSRVARAFMRKIAGQPPIRFDVLSVYLEPGLPPDITLFENAFTMR
ncbi:MAG: hypothetical protein DMG65_21140 [Candidatus Angelobacter sp. Gp1-AA117]|nr:MAG: hypothetical protein DMG65_21140 [Candidatus Angelobacter sp. Gp1-AA117]